MLALTPSPSDSRVPVSSLMAIRSTSWVMVGASCSLALCRTCCRSCSCWLKPAVLVGYSTDGSTWAVPPPVPCAPVAHQQPDGNRNHDHQHNHRADDQRQLAVWLFAAAGIPGKAVRLWHAGHAGGTLLGRFFLFAGLSDSILHKIFIPYLIYFFSAGNHFLAHPPCMFPNKLRPESAFRACSRLL